MDSAELDANNILSRYGGVSANMLKNFLDAYKDDDDNNNEPDLIRDSPYYSLNKLPQEIRSDNGYNSIITLNVDGILSKIDEVRLLVQICSYQGIYIDVICIQESRLNDSYTQDNPSIQIQGYDCIPQGKYCGEKGGLITYVREIHESRKLTYESITKSNTWEGLYVEVKYENGHRSIISNVYKPPRNNNNNANIKKFMDELLPVLQLLDKEGCDITMAGDTNINLLQLNERIKFQEFFDMLTNFSLYPKITFPTRICQTRSTLLDNIFCKLTKNTVDSIAGVIFTTISDHFPCFVAIKPRQCENINDQTKKDTNFVRVKAYTEEPIEKINSELLSYDYSQDMTGILDDSPVDPNGNYNTLIAKIIEVKDKNMPTKLVKFNKRKHKKQKWMTNGILKSINFRDKLRLNLIKLDSSTTEYSNQKTNLKTFNSILKKNIREAKYTYYNDLFHKYKEDIKNTWKHINGLISKRTRKEIKQLLINGQKVEDKQQIANEFNTFFANIGSKLASSINTNNKKPYNHYLTKTIFCSFNFELYEPEDTLKIIKGLKAKESTGHDGISMKFIKAIAPSIVLPLTAILNQSLLTGIFPDQMKIAKVIPMFKKENRELMDNYRPVSLLSAFSKIFERAAYNQIYNYFTSNNLFYENQYGFRQQHSTELASLELIDRIFEDLNKENNPITIFMDLSKAFDTLDHKILIKKLHYYGIRGTALNWFISYLSNRKQFVQINSYKSSMLPLNTGVPQGSILGPLLFLIYMNDIPNSSDLFDFILFADDTSLKSFINTRNFLLSLASSKLNLELSKVNDWLAVNKLSLNIKKTKFMIFHTSKKNIQNCIPNLQIGGVEIERVQNFNFLGLKINENLSWKPHTDMIANKISKYVGVLNRLKRYLPSYILKTIYVSLIQSNLNYCILAWGFNCGRLKKLQKKAIRIVCNGKYLEHTTPLLKKLEILKLEDMFVLCMLKWYFKYEQKQLPRYFLKFKIEIQHQTHEHDNRDKNRRRVPVPRLFMSRHCIRNHISTVINCTDTCIIEKIYTHSLQGYSKYIKKHILSNYSEECNIENCYSCNQK